MKTMQLRTIAVAMCAASILTACAATVPQELSSAREAYRRASTGPASRLTPAEVHKASEALNVAEQSFVDAPESYHTRDLAYVALRKAEIAESIAEAAIQQEAVAQSNAAYSAAQGQLVTETKRELGESRADLAKSQRAGQATSAQLEAEKRAREASERRGVTTDAQLVESKRAGAVTAARLESAQAARIDADRRAAAATLALANLAAVKEEARGLVITLSGSVLFASDRFELLPAARSRLARVADALMAGEQRSLVIEGHTDSRGSAEHNSELSLRRADSVRTFLVAKGYQANLVTAQGIGQDRPIADNATADGRANNRRVEIVVAPDPTVSAR